MYVTHTGGAMKCKMGKKGRRQEVKDKDRLKGSVRWEGEHWGWRTWYSLRMEKIKSRPPFYSSILCVHIKEKLNVPVMTANMTCRFNPFCKGGSFRAFQSSWQDESGHVEFQLCWNNKNLWLLSRKNKQWKTFVALSSCNFTSNGSIMGFCSEQFIVNRIYWIAGRLQPWVCHFLLVKTLVVKEILQSFYINIRFNI